jgi:hypothetical protein
MSYSIFNLITALSLLLWYAYHIFSHLLSINHKCTQPCPIATQKKKKIWSTLIWCSKRAIATDQLSVELWCLSTVMLPRVFDLVFYKTLFSNKYYILWHWLFCIYFLYSMCVNLIPRHTYYEHPVCLKIRCANVLARTLAVLTRGRTVGHMGPTYTIGPMLVMALGRHQTKVFPGLQKWP